MRENFTYRGWDVWQEDELGRDGKPIYGCGPPESYWGSRWDATFWSSIDQAIHEIDESIERDLKKMCRFSLPSPLRMEGSDGAVYCLIAYLGDNRWEARDEGWKVVVISGQGLRNPDWSEFDQQSAGGPQVTAEEL